MSTLKLISPSGLYDYTSPEAFFAAAQDDWIGRFVGDQTHTNKVPVGNGSQGSPLQRVILEVNDGDTVKISPAAPADPAIEIANGVGDLTIRGNVDGRLQLEQVSGLGAALAVSALGQADGLIMQDITFLGAHPTNVKFAVAHTGSSTFRRCFTQDTPTAGTFVSAAAGHSDLYVDQCDVRREKNIWAGVYGGAITRSRIECVYIVASPAGWFTWGTTPVWYRNLFLGASTAVAQPMFTLAGSSPGMIIVANDFRGLKSYVKANCDAINITAGGPLTEVIRNNGFDGYLAGVRSSNAITLTNCGFYNNTANVAGAAVIGAGCKTSDPLWLAAESDAIPGNSPWVDAGAALGSPYDDEDREGRTVPQRSGVDIGSYECPEPLTLRGGVALGSSGASSRVRILEVIGADDGRATV